MEQLIKTQDVSSLTFEQIIRKQGFTLDYRRHGGWGRICCISTAFTDFLRIGNVPFEEALHVVKASWDGHPDSLRHEVLDSVIRFVELYYEEYDPERLIARLRKVKPTTILIKGKADNNNLSGYRRFLYQVYLIYIGKSSKYFLPRKF